MSCEWHPFFSGRSRRRGIVVVGALAILAVLGMALWPEPTRGDSTCYGSTAEGALRNGCRLPSSGENFKAYSRLGSLLGRTWVHCSVRDVVLAAYAALAEASPDAVFVYGETGLAGGGPFAPHKTHQNGLSVDFMVPVRNRAGDPVRLPTSPMKKFGYGIEFDASGKYGNLDIDFDAMALHVEALSRAAREAGFGIWRVIFDPKLQPLLRETEAWPRIAHLRFSKKRSWVRHDEHYHVDFEVPCDALGELPEE